MFYFIYKDAQNQWRWRLYAANSRIIASSGDGYNNKKACIHAISLVKGSANAPVRGQ
jgi:uncharacterized protein YegP (UPF0339 family)